MDTVHELIVENGGIEKLPDHSPLRFDIDSDRYMTIEYCGISPSRFPAVGVSVFQNENGRRWHSRIILERTGLGLLPFYLKTRTGDVYQVYRLSRRGRIRKVRRDIRAFLVRVVYDWDQQLDVLLAGGEVLQT